MENGSNGGWSDAKEIKELLISFLFQPFPKILLILRYEFINFSL